MVVAESSEAFTETQSSPTTAEKVIAEQTASASKNSIRNGVFSFLSKKPASKMLMEAIKTLDNEGRGASLPAIIKWIAGNYAVADLNKLKLQMKKALLRGLQSGTVERSQISRAALGTNGSFILAGETTHTRRKSAPRKKAPPKGVAEEEAGHSSC